MSVPAAYLGIILIWSTTPLAIKWSGEEAGFAFGVAARMVIGALLCLLLIRVLRVELPWHRDAVRVYLAAGGGIFAAMLCVYWGAQHISSGLVSVLFGLTPLATGVMASYWLDERFFVAPKLIGTALGLWGLLIIFGAGGQLTEGVGLGIAAVLAAMLLQSASAVWVKRLATDLHPLTVNAGALSIAVPLFVLTWWLVDGHWPAALSLRSGAAIAYLGVFGTVLGFVLYFYVLKQLPAGVIALITLITPVSALLIGQGLNGEVIEADVWLGTALIMVGLLAYQWGGRVGRGMAAFLGRPG